MQNVDHNICFWEKRQFFRRKLSKIAENCDHNIDPWMAIFFKEKNSPKNGDFRPVKNRPRLALIRLQFLSQKAIFNIFFTKRYKKFLNFFLFNT
jgi:hypothetical protein